MMVYDGKISRWTHPSYIMDIFNIIRADDWCNLGRQGLIYYLGVPFKIGIQLEDVVNRACFWGPIIKVVVFVGVKWRYRLLFPFNFYNKFINFGIEIGNTEFRFENTINFLIYSVFNFEFRIARDGIPSC